MTTQKALTPELLAEMMEKLPEQMESVMAEFGDEVKAVVAFSVQQQQEAEETARNALERNVMGRIVFPSTLKQVGQDKNYNRRLRTTARRIFLGADVYGSIRHEMREDIQAMVKKYQDLGVGLFEKTHTGVQDGAIVLRGKDSDKDEDSE